MAATARRAVLLAAIALALPAAAGAKEPAPSEDLEVEVDAELLEFLGGIDELDEEWMDYLTQTDIEKVVKSEPAPEGRKE